VENLGELQATAVKAGLNGVMMGNFLTTLGNEPETDREMFEELGLNVARQPDNASNPRPDNRDGWMEGETPDVIEELISEPPPAELAIRLWDPSTQLRFKAKRRATLPDGDGPRPDKVQAA
jgi:biotin synthase